MKNFFLSPIKWVGTCFAYETWLPNPQVNTIVQVYNSRYQKK